MVEFLDCYRFLHFSSVTFFVSSLLIYLCTTDIIQEEIHVMAQKESFLNVFMGLFVEGMDVSLVLSVIVFIIIYPCQFPSLDQDYPGSLGTALTLNVLSTCL